jgi:hypothetical protein
MLLLAEALPNTQNPAGSVVALRQLKRREAAGHLAMSEAVLLQCQGNDTKKADQKPLRETVSHGLNPVCVAGGLSM